MGEHRHPGSEGGVALGFRGGAVAEAHHDAPFGQGGDHGASPLQFRGQGHQIDVAFKAVDAFHQGGQARGGQVLGGMGAPATGLKEGTLQVGAQ